MVVQYETVKNDLALVIQKIRLSVIQFHFKIRSQLTILLIVETEEDLELLKLPIRSVLTVSFIMTEVKKIKNPLEVFIITKKYWKNQNIFMKLWIDRKILCTWMGLLSSTTGTNPITNPKPNIILKTKVFLSPIKYLSDFPICL